MNDIPEGQIVDLGKNNGGFCGAFDPTTEPRTPPTATTTWTSAPATTPTPSPVPMPPNCQEMQLNGKVVRNTMLAYGCDLGEQCMSRETWSQISCIDDIRKKSEACVQGSEKMDCKSLEKLAKSISAALEVCQQDLKKPLNNNDVIPDSISHPSPSNKGDRFLPKKVIFVKEKYCFDSFRLWGFTFSCKTFP